MAHYQGLIIHTFDLKARVEEILRAVRPLTDENPGHILVIGGGKSGWE
jgi:dimethylaniline monooxygenase (N-oxide forming)